MNSGAAGFSNVRSQLLKRVNEDKIKSALKEDEIAARHMPVKGFAPCDSQINLRVPKAVKNELKRRADADDKSVTAYIIWCANVMGMAHGEDVALRIAPRGHFLKAASQAAKKR